MKTLEKITNKSGKSGRKESEGFIVIAKPSSISLVEKRNLLRKCINILLFNNGALGGEQEVKQKENYENY